MNDIRLDTSFFENPKIRKLRKRLGDPAVLGLVRLWCYAAKNRKKGIFYDMTDDEIEEILSPNRKRKGLWITALVELNLLHIGDDMTIIIHDWDKNQPWVCNSEERSATARENASKRWGKTQDPNKSRDPYANGNTSGNASGNPNRKASRNAPSPSPTPTPSPAHGTTPASAVESAEPSSEIEDPKARAEAMQTIRKAMAQLPAASAEPQTPKSQDSGNGRIPRAEGPEVEDMGVRLQAVGFVDPAAQDILDAWWAREQGTHNEYALAAALDKHSIKGQDRGKVYRCLGVV
jgi:hypothetical protein